MMAGLARGMLRQRRWGPVHSIGWIAFGAGHNLRADNNRAGLQIGAEAAGETNADDAGDFAFGKHGVELRSQSRRIATADHGCDALSLDDARLTYEARDRDDHLRGRRRQRRELPILRLR